MSALLGAQTGPASPEEMFRAIRNDDLARLRALLAEGADVNTKDKRGTTLLMTAAGFGSPQAVRLLLEAKAEVNAANSAGQTALVWAVNDAEKVRMLLDKGADVNARTRQERTALIAAAAQQGNLEVVKLLLDKGADPKATDKLGVTPLLAAAFADDLEVVKLLLGLGADVNAASKVGDTPLMGVAAAGNLEAVRLLLSKGANVNAATSFGGEVKFGPIALRQLTPLMLAAPFGAPVMATLIEAGAQVNAKDVRGMTPLMLAVATDHHDAGVVKLLLAKGAAVNEKSAAGETALDWGLKFGNPDVIGALKEAGAVTAATVTPTPSAAKPVETRAALGRTVALLQTSTTEFFRQSGCSGCHHQNMTAIAVAAARRKGIPVNEAAAAEQVKTVKFQTAGAVIPGMERFDGPTVDIPLFALLGLAAEGYTPDEITDGAVFNIAANQRVNGTWRMGGISRAPMEEGDIGRTALGIRALQTFGMPGRKAEFERRVDRARAWLLEAPAKSTDDRVMRILGLKWAGADAQAIARFARELAGLQRADGGWAPTPHLSSDAFATGEALFALRHGAGMAVSDSVYRQGIEYLLRTQLADGSWYVRSRAPKFQPYFESGFPHGHDQWISAAASAWAAAALAEAVEPQRASLEAERATAAP